MARLRLQTQLLIATLLTICALAGAMLIVIRHTVRSEIAEEVRDSTAASVRTFENVQKQRQLQLSSAAAMLAELPTLKALMTTEHALTIQDGSVPFWKLAASDLFLLADPTGEVRGFHVGTPGLKSGTAKEELVKSIKRGEDTAWWYADARLYWVFIRPIAAGIGRDTKQLGIVVIGYQVDSTLAEQLALVSNSRIALATGGRVIASTLSPRENVELQTRVAQSSLDLGSDTQEMVLANERYQVAAVSLRDAPPAPIQCYVLVPLRRRMSFIARLDRTILVLGVTAVLLASLLLSFVARTITRPMDNLVAGVRALAAGDYAYSITPRGSKEVVELGEAFSTMRDDLLASQRQRIETERIAALGRAASSISHDLRHYLAALVANAEFLYEARRLKLDRNEIYGEIKTAAEQMTELLDSLRELASEHRTILPVPASVDESLRRAIDTVVARPEMRDRTISVARSGEMTGTFDPKKIERAFFNLVLNACQATPDHNGKIVVDIASSAEVFEVRVADNGGGIPDSIRRTLFDPFVSSGKSNGTGLGLAIVSQIIHDHDGSVIVERTSETGTVFLVRLPRFQHAATENPYAQTEDRLRT